MSEVSALKALIDQKDDTIFRLNNQNLKLFNDYIVTREECDKLIRENEELKKKLTPRKENPW